MQKPPSRIRKPLSRKAALIHSPSCYYALCVPHILACPACRRNIISELLGISLYIAADKRFNKLTCLVILMLDCRGLHEVRTRGKDRPGKAAVKRDLAGAQGINDYAR